MAQVGDCSLLFPPKFPDLNVISSCQGQGSSMWQCDCDFTSLVKRVLKCKFGLGRHNNWSPSDPLDRGSYWIYYHNKLIVVAMSLFADGGTAVLATYGISLLPN